MPFRSRNWGLHAAEETDQVVEDWHYWMKREQLAQHVAVLCREHDVTIRYRDRVGGYALKRQRMIVIRPVKTERTYLIALHELGHIVGTGRSGRRLEQEAAAWAFVLEATIVPLSPASYRAMRKALESYLAKATRVKHMVVPPAGSTFWQVYEQIREAASPEAACRSRSARETLHATEYAGL